MSAQKRGGKSQKTQSDLCLVAHSQIMDFLQQAEASTNPAVTEIALKLAENRQAQHHKSEEKLSPTHATLLATFIVISASGACWVAIVEYPGKVGLEIAGIVTSLAILAICIYALFSGYLSQANFIILLRWVGDRLKFLRFWEKPASSELTIQAKDDED